MQPQHYNNCIIEYRYQFYCVAGWFDYSYNIQISKFQNMAQEVEEHVLARYNLTKKVGSGAYGHVWKVTDRKTGITLALKKIFDAFQHSVDAQRTYREICIIHQLSHPNIIKLFNVIRANNDKDLYLVFEFMQADLHNAIGQKILKDIHNRFIMYQICKGMKYLHSAEIIHRDLKPANILINSDCHLKICDFGLARSLANDAEDRDLIMTEEVATRWYRAPEVLLGSQTYDKSADIWSIGCILAELLLGKPIFPGNSTLNQLQRILSFTGKPKRQDIDSLNTEVAYTMIDSIVIHKVKPVRQWFKNDVSEEAFDLLVKMLQFNPFKRISIIQILKHPYLLQFSSPKEETVSKRPIYPSVSDNKRLNLKQYKQLIYDRIRKIYNQPSQNSIGQYKKSSSSAHRSSEIMREKNGDKTVTSQKTHKMASSVGKYHCTSPTNSSGAYITANSTLLNEQQREKLRKKQSLKDILKNKRQKSAGKLDKNQTKVERYESFHMYGKQKSPAASNLLARYYKNNIGSSGQGFLKQNKNAVGFSKYC